MPAEPEVATPGAAQLGATADPQALIPGRPDALEAAAQALQAHGQKLVTAGEDMRGVTVPGWSGPAADAFSTSFSREPPKWLGLGDAYDAAGNAVAGYSVTLRWAQGEAAHAADLWQRAQAASATFQAQQAAAPEVQAMAAPATTGAGAPTADPGVEMRTRAQAVLDNARAQLDSAGYGAESELAPRLRAALIEAAVW